MEINGVFITVILLFFVLPYIVAIIIFSRKKNYNVIRLFCGFTVLWILISIIFTGIIYILTGGIINTSNGIKSSFELSVFIGFLIGWLITLAGGLSIIERTGTEDAGTLSKDIIKNGQQIILIRLLIALVVLIFGLPLKLIYKWAKNTGGL